MKSWKNWRRFLLPVTGITRAFWAGRSDKEVRTVYLALDATDDVIDNAVECRADMIITHHPLIFKPLKKSMMKISSAGVFLK